MYNEKDIPDCFGAVKQITSIPTSSAMHKSAQNSKAGVVVKFSIE
jgi:hypothetical protein